MTMRQNTRVHGWVLLELAIALIIVGGLVSLLLPLWSAQATLESARQDVSNMQAARDALMRQAVLANGLPAPLRFLEDNYGAGEASSHSEVDPDLTALAPGWPGALPAQLLGVPSHSALQTAYWYDVNPALRSDADLGFFPLSQQISGNWSFESVLSQFDPDINPNLGTGGHARQLCRNVNSLQAIEQSIRTYPDNTSAGYRRDHINLALPRIWTTGYEDNFTWDSALGYAGLSVASQEPEDAAFENSSAAAFVVVRRQPPALRRLDRQNTVYAQVGLTGLDPTLSSRGGAAYPSFAVERGFRIYEHPQTRAVDALQSDANDYGGRVEAITLGEFAYGLQKAGMCTAAEDRCKANQLFVRFANYTNTAPPSGNSEPLFMRWQLIDPLESAPDDVLQSGDVASGSASNGVCLDAFDVRSATTATARRLRISFVSPSGALGYATGDYWYRGGWLVDPTATPLPSADNGVNRWRNIEALSAAVAGNPVTITCTGSHTVTASGSSGQLVAAGPSLPACSVSQTP